MRVRLFESSGLSRAELMQYGWISGDHNPIHFDEKVADGRGLPGLIVHGMFLYCIVYKAIDDFLLEKSPDFRIKELSSKFSGMTFVNDSFRVEVELDESKELSDPSARNKVFLLNKDGEANCIFQAVFIRRNP
ncbi:hypothetical protein GW915_01550 [bacterium]|nr:hypothetical protein [bacterium]